MTRSARTMTITLPAADDVAVEEEEDRFDDSQENDCAG